MNVINKYCTCGKQMFCDTDLPSCQHKPGQSIASTDTTPADLGGATGKTAEENKNIRVSTAEDVQSMEEAAFKARFIPPWEVGAKEKILQSKFHGDVYEVFSSEEIRLIFEMMEQYAQQRVSEVREQGYDVYNALDAIIQNMNKFSSANLIENAKEALYNYKKSKL